jgi:hypothetical protein
MNRREVLTWMAGLSVPILGCFGSSTSGTAFGQQGQSRQVVLAVSGMT